MSERIVFKGDYKLDKEGYVNLNCSFSGVENQQDFLLIKPIKPGLTFTSFQTIPGIFNEFDFEIENAPIEFVYCVSGRSCFSFSDSKFKKQKYVHSKAGMNMISNISSVSGKFHIHRKDNFKTIGLHLDPKLIYNFFIPYMDRLSKDIKEIFSTKTRDFHLPLFMNPKMEKIVWEIINSNYTDSLGDLYLESKTLELLTIQLESLINYEKRKKIAFVTPEDIDRIYEARNILVRNFESPPTIIQLARMSGVNEFKLKKGFKEIFGTTIFGYLKKHRMDYAKDLINGGGINVSQIAYSVGYSNVSHFITAYKKEFGITPGEYIRKNFSNVA